MFSHVCLGVRDLQRATRFYDALLEPLGLRQRHVEPDGGPPGRCWITPGQPLPRFFVTLPFNGEPATAGNGTMAAFLAPSEESVCQAYAAGLAAGGSDEGSPGFRPQYAEGYFGAYLRDPDGKKVHVVYRGDMVEHQAGLRHSRRSNVS